MPESNNSRLHDNLFALTALLALGVALVSVLNIERVSQSQAVAMVNATPVPQAEYARALDAMQSGLERSLTDADKARALKILIDEELIVQDALQLGLADSDRLVRKNLVQAMMRSVTSLVQDDVSEVEQRAFFADNAGLFAAPESFTVQAVRLGTPEQARLFVQALDADASFAGSGEQAKGVLVDVAARLPIGKISAALGGPAGELVAQMREGDIAGPVTSQDGQVFIWLTEKRGGPVAFEEARDAVLVEMKRRQDEEALAAYVEHLRSRARIKHLSPE